MDPDYHTNLAAELGIKTLIGQKALEQALEDAKNLDQRVQSGEKVGADPKGEAGKKKCPMHLLPPFAIKQTAWVHGLGARKYGPWNWRKDKVEAMTYVGAILRHLAEWSERQDNDPESGFSHLAHIAASCNILMDAENQGSLIDNRP